MCDDPTPAELAMRRCPGFTPDAVLARTGKSALVRGTYRGTAAVAKLLTDPAPLWRRRFTAEIHTYHVFATHPPPVQPPRLLMADAAAGVLVLEHIPGHPAATTRFPAAPLPPTTIDTLITAVDALARWTSPAGQFPAVFDYPQRFTRYGPDGYDRLTRADVDRLTALYDDLTKSGQAGLTFAHGDVLPANFLLTGNGCVLLDWEFAGLYLPGFDHALLWTLLGADPAARARLLASATRGGPDQQAALWINAAMATTRELRTHRELSASPQRDHRLAALTADLDTVRAHLTHLAPGGRRP